MGVSDRYIWTSRMLAGWQQPMHSLDSDMSCGHFSAVYAPRAKLNS